jgi:hypothetical protein
MLHFKEKLMVAQLVKNYSFFCDNWIFLTIITKPGTAPSQKAVKPNPQIHFLLRSRLIYVQRYSTGFLKTGSWYKYSLTCWTPYKVRRKLGDVFWSESVLQDFLLWLLWNQRSETAWTLKRFFTLLSGAGQLSQLSVWPRTGQPGDRGSIPGRGERIFPLASVSRPALGQTQPPVRWVPGVKRGRGLTLITHPI